MSTSAQPDFLNIIISRQQVESGDTSTILPMLLKMLTPEAAIQFRERVDIAVHGYDDDPRELYDVPEVRDFVRKLDDEFPYWCYFLSKRGSGLLFILYCFCSPCLMPEVRDRIEGEEVAQYLLKRGFPAMNALCEATGCCEAEVKQLTDRVMEYIIGGPARGEE